MELTESIVNQFMADFILPFSRVSALIMTMIGFSAKTIPGRVKLFLCLSITMAIMPAIPRLSSAVPRARCAF
jgi:flagellar biosynthetic protein FliR